MTQFLEVDNLIMRFGGLTAVDGLSFKLDHGEIHGLIGPNGAGKTTTFNMISGFYKPSGGQVRLRGESISGLRMHEVARRGVVRTFQHSTLFAEMTVMDNALVGTHMPFRPNIFAAIIGWDKDDREGARARAREALEFFGLDHLRDELAGELSHGHQRALGMAVAYASHPDVMLLDEPFTGMNPEETRRMMDLMRRLRDDGITILIVEHDMQAIMGLCDNITCMSFGKFLAEGNPAEIRNHPAVIEAYLGARAMLLEMKDVSVNYGKVSAVRDISLSVPDGAIVTIIGGNGAGKTTSLRAMSGMVPLHKGEIHFDGQRIDGLSSDKIVARGIAHVPEGRRIFPDMTVEENLRTGAFLRRDHDKVARDLDGVFDRFPACANAAANWPRPCRGRTADAGDRTGADVGAAAVADGRALDGPCAGDRRGNRPHHRGYQRTGRAGGAGRTERRTGAGTGQPCLCAGNRKHGTGGPRR